MVVPAYPGRIVILYNVIVEKKMFLGVLSVVRMTTRWYDEYTNTNIQFLMVLFFVLYHLMLSANF